MRLRGAALALLVALVAHVGSAETRAVQAAGAVPVDPRAVGAAEGSRDAALRAALSEAIGQVAASLLPGKSAQDGKPLVARALPGSPFDYVSRYRVIEDRGVRPRLLLEDPAVTHEHAIVVEARVDLDRVRARLVQAGLLAAPVPMRPQRRVTLTLEGLASYSAYADARAQLRGRLGGADPVPVAFERGRAVLAVDTDRDLAEVAAGLAAVEAGAWRLETVSAEPDALTLRCVERPPAPEGAGAAPTPVPDPDSGAPSGAAAGAARRAD